MRLCLVQVFLCHLILGTAAKPVISTYSSIDIDGEGTFEVGSDVTVVCEIPSYDLFMNWKIGLDTVADCTLNTCTARIQLPGHYSFSYDTDSGIFNLTINQVKYSDDGFMLECENENGADVLNVTVKDTTLFTTITADSGVTASLNVTVPSSIHTAVTTANSSVYDFQDTDVSDSSCWCSPDNYLAVCIVISIGSICVFGCCVCCCCYWKKIWCFKKMKSIDCTGFSSVRQVKQTPDNSQQLRPTSGHPAAHINETDPEQGNHTAEGPSPANHGERNHTPEEGQVTSAANLNIELHNLEEMLSDFTQNSRRNNVVKKQLEKINSLIHKYHTNNDLYRTPLRDELKKCIKELKKKRKLPEKLQKIKEKIEKILNTQPFNDSETHLEQQDGT